MLTLPTGGLTLTKYFAPDSNPGMGSLVGLYITSSPVINGTSKPKEISENLFEILLKFCTSDAFVLATPTSISYDGNEFDAAYTFLVVSTYMFVISDVKVLFPNSKGILLLDAVFNCLLMSYNWPKAGTKVLGVRDPKLICLPVILSSTTAVACGVCSFLTNISILSPFLSCDLSTSVSNSGVVLLDALYGVFIWKREAVL